MIEISQNLIDLMQQAKNLLAKFERYKINLGFLTLRYEKYVDI